MTLFFWAWPGIVQLAQGHSDCLSSKETQRGIKLPTSGSAGRYLNNWTIQPSSFSTTLLYSESYSWARAWRAERLRDFLISRIICYWLVPLSLVHSCSFHINLRGRETSQKYCNVFVKQNTLGHLGFEQILFILKKLFICYLLLKDKWWPTSIKIMKLKTKIINYCNTNR